MPSTLDAFVSLIVYVSADNQQSMLRCIPDFAHVLRAHFRAYEVIIVNDTAQHFSQAAIEYLQSNNVKQVILLDMAYNHGMERAMTAGADLSVGDFVIELDYPIEGKVDELVIYLYSYATEYSADIVGLVPRNAQRMGSLLFYSLLQRLGTTSNVLRTEAARIISRRALNRVLKERNSFRFRKISYALSGFRYATVTRSDVVITKHQSRGERLALATDVLMSFSRFGSSVARSFSLVFALISILLGLYSLLVRVVGMPIAEGWTTLMIFLALGFSGIFFILYALSRTIEICLQELQHISPYTVREVIRLDNR